MGFNALAVMQQWSKAVNERRGKPVLSSKVDRYCLGRVMMMGEERGTARFDGRFALSGRTGGKEF